jgi:hypothetical protein
MSEDSVSERMSDRGERRAFNFLNEGLFRPLTISKDIQNIFQSRASELGVPDPYESAQGIIDSIRDQLSSTSLRGDLFPEIQNPFNKLFLPEITLGSTPAGQLPPLVTAANTNVMNANATYGKIPTVAGKTTVEELNEVFTNNR